MKERGANRWKQLLLLCMLSMNTCSVQVCKSDQRLPTCPQAEVENLTSTEEAPRLYPETDPDLNPSHRKFVSAKASVKIQIKLISVTEILKNINSVVSNCLSNRHSLCSSVLLIVNAALSC